MSRMKLKHRRLQLLSSTGFPTQSEVRCQLGGPLAEVFFDSLDDNCKEDLGLIPPLKGVQDSKLWMSPSDILAGKVLMTIPMPTRRVVRALTHQGILEIGDECLHKLANENALDKQQCLIELQMNLEAAAKVERDKAVELATRELKELHNQEIEELLEQCRLDVSTAVAETVTRAERANRELIQQEREEVHGLMQDKLENEMQTLENRLTEEFLSRMNETVRELNAYYGQFIGDQIAHFNWRLQMEMIEQENYKLQLGYRMEAQNASDVAYAVCRERQRCEDAKGPVRRAFEEQMERLQATIDSQIAQLQLATTENEAKETRFEAWVERVRELVNEFQKFINYALKAVPGQAQFLLSLEKLLKMKLDKPIEEVSNEEVDVTESSHTQSEETLTVASEGVKISDSSTTTYSTTTSKSVGSAKESVLTATVPVAIVLDELLTMSTPLNTEPEDVIGEIIGDLIMTMTPDPETEEIVNAIVDELVCETVPLDKLRIDVSTQIPQPREESEDTLSKKSSRLHERGSKYKAGEDGVSKCAWCEIKKHYSTSVCTHVLDPIKTHSSRVIHVEELPAVEVEVETVTKQERTCQETGYVGEGGKEHQQPDAEFVNDRLQSLLKIFRRHPSLTQVFIK